MNEEEREAFLANFTDTPATSTVAFCVLGGIFSEGIDLKGERLSGVAVISVGLPQINHENNALKDYYQTVDAKGFNYAYQIPGINKVIQAGGRVIRTANDVGVILLLDERFCYNDYKNLLPFHWFPQRLVRSDEELAETLSAFWTTK
jgi:Rad3-related DNA helicase